MHGKIISSFQIKIQINTLTNTNFEAKALFAVFAHLLACLPTERGAKAQHRTICTITTVRKNRFPLSIQFRERILFSLSLETTGKIWIKYGGD